MKKKILNIVLALTVVIAGFTGFSNTAQAENVGVSWDVDYDGTQVTSHFAEKYKDGTKDALSQVMPGDNLYYEVTYTNKSKEAANFYVNAGVVRTLESSSDGGAGGAYSYVITNNGEVLFDSETVGGDNETKVGLDQVDKGESSYFSLGSIQPGQSGVIKVSVKLDGNTINNAYMTTLLEKELAPAALDIRFGAQPTTEAEYVEPHEIVNHKNIVNRVVKKLDNGTQIVVIDDDNVPLAGPRTGDTILPLVICGAMLFAGLLLIGWYFIMTKNSRREEA